MLRYMATVYKFVCVAIFKSKPNRQKRTQKVQPKTDYS